MSAECPRAIHCCRSIFCLGVRVARVKMHAVEAKLFFSIVSCAGVMGVVATRQALGAASWIPSFC